MSDKRSSPPAQQILGFSSADFAGAVGAVLDETGAPRYRLGQLREWVYRRTPERFESITVLPKQMRELCAERFTLHPLEPVLSRVSADGTQKFLWRTTAGHTIESVLIPDRDRVTYCISTQAGCPVKCTFCATGYGGFAGQLSAGEIVDQLVRMRLASGKAPTNVVFMGMGEPLLNFDAVSRSLSVLTAADQIAFGARRITVSTVGIPERIRELGRAFPQVKLALSLHAARDELRDRIIPLNTRYPLASVLAAVADHQHLTGRHATFEYIVLPAVNDAPQDARELANIAAATPSRINLIGYNPFPGGPYRKPELARLLEFRDQVSARFSGDVTIRRSRGEDIQGACGQLSLQNAAH